MISKKKEIEELINSSHEILKDLSISLETDNLKCIEPGDWNYPGNGMFIPHSMTAFVKMDDDWQYNLLHEHIGHRTYFENTQHGEHLRIMEKELSMLESMIIRYEKQDIISFEVRHDIIDPIIENNNGTTKVFYNTSFPIAASHYDLSQKILNFMNKLEPQAEAFADWLTQHIAKKNGINVRIPKNSKESNLYQELTKEEYEFGPLRSLYKANIKRNHQNKYLLKVLNESFEDLSEFENIIKFGSNKPYSDLDFLIVVDDFSPPTFPSYLDISFATTTELKEGLRLRDIHFTIPVLDGCYLKGKERKKELMKIIETPPSKEDYNSMLKKQYTKAKMLADKCFDAYLQERRSGITPNALANAGRALVNASYANTYKELFGEVIIPRQENFIKISDSDARIMFKKIMANPHVFDEKKIYEILQKT